MPKCSHAHYNDVTHFFVDRSIFWTKLEHEKLFFFVLFDLKSWVKFCLWVFLSLQFLEFSFTTEHKIEFWNNYSLDGHIGIVRLNRTFPFNVVYSGKRQTATIFVTRNSITELCWTKFITKVTKLKSQCKNEASDRQWDSLSPILLEVSSK